MPKRAATCASRPKPNWRACGGGCRTRCSALTSPTTRSCWGATACAFPCWCWMDASTMRHSIGSRSSAGWFRRPRLVAVRRLSGMDADSRFPAARPEPTAAAAGAGRDEQVTTAANDAGMPQASAMTSGGRARAPTLGPSAAHERTESAAVEHVGKSSAEPSQTREFSSDALQPRPVSAVARHAGKSSQERPADETSADGHQPRNPFRHWLATVNTAIGVFLLGALAAPMFDVLGWQAAAGWLYAAYHFTCHEWAFRSFFLFGTASPLPIAVYAEHQLVATTADPFGFIGNADFA